MAIMVNFYKKYNATILARSSALMLLLGRPECHQEPTGWGVRSDICGGER